MNSLGESLRRLQNRAARIVSGKPYDYPATSILKDLDWPSVKDTTLKETSSMISFKSTYFKHLGQE